MGFYLMQRGSFRDIKKEYTGLTGNNGLINLDYMGSTEFEWGAIPKAYRRILGHKDDYIYHYCNDIKDYNGKIMVVYCKKDDVEKIEKEIKQFIEKPYHLKEYSTLDTHIRGPKYSGDKYKLEKDFFWCIDLGSDWMAWFGMDKMTAFKKYFELDYNGWWMSKDKKEREKEFNAAWGRR